eukprot:1701282-Prymnesium_polylepis.2
MAHAQVQAELAKRATEPDPRSLSGIDVSAEHASLRAILDSPKQRHRASPRYEGFLGQFKPAAIKLGEALFAKGGKKLMVEFLERYVNDSLSRRTVDFAWSDVRGADWGCRATCGRWEVRSPNSAACGHIPGNFASYTHQQRHTLVQLRMSHDWRARAAQRVMGPGGCVMKRGSTGH